DSVIISLWSVGDEQASRFFTAFYQALLSGSTAADALYQTKRSFIEDSGNAGAWAAFQLFSN
ncbi:MAG TPA: CHAT domain-containing protein, partial [Xanthomonadales bacterium]|nr:CHAT domain-containing protein [Xanthomonadales bacterium]